MWGVSMVASTTAWECQVLTTLLLLKSWTSSYKAHRGTAASLMTQGYFTTFILNHQTFLSSGHFAAVCVGKDWCQEYRPVFQSCGWAHAHRSVCKSLWAWPKEDTKPTRTQPCPVLYLYLLLHMKCSCVASAANKENYHIEIQTGSCLQSLEVLKTNAKCGK